MHNIYHWFSINVAGDWNENVSTGNIIFFWFLVAVAIFVVLLIVFGIYSLIDWLTGHNEFDFGVIINHQYEPSTESTGVGTGITSSGGVATVVTHSGHPESYDLVVRETGTNTVYKIGVDMQTYYDSKNGQKVQYKKRIGGISGTIYSVKLA